MIKLEVASDKTVFFAGKTFSYKDTIRAIPGTRWDKREKRWVMPLESVQDAVRILPTIGVSDDVKAVYQDMIARHERAIEVKKIDESKVCTKVEGLKGTLYPYQAVGVEFLKTLTEGEGNVLAFDMGLGKSLTSLAYGQHLLNYGEIDRILVVCPSKLKYATWAKEIEKWTSLSYIVVDGDRSEVVEWDDGVQERLTGRKLREVQYQQCAYDTQVLIMNYELFLTDLEQTSEAISWVKEYTFKKEAREAFRLFAQRWAERFEEELDDALWAHIAYRYISEELQLDPTMYKIGAPKTRPYLARKEDASHRIIPNIDGRWLVILDEAHRIKNPKAVTTTNLVKALKGAGRKVLGTGTPLENNIQELWTLTNFCRTGILGNYYKFVERYVETDFFGTPIAPKPQMLPELMRKLDPILLRKTKAEALPDLPPLTVMNHTVGMTPAQEKLYLQVKEGILEVQREMGTDFTYVEALAQITRLQQVCDSPALLRELVEDPTLPEESGKLKELKFILSEVRPSENKFILFSQYANMTDILYKWLIEERILTEEQIGYVKGGISPKRVEEVRKGFQDGGIQCVLMTTAGNYGLDLYEASYVICYDQLFNPQKMAQIYARAHRNGASKPITAINLITENSYEEKKLDILERKRDLFNAVIEEDETTMAKLFGSPSDLLKVLL